jgi:hypothetical protein
MRSTNVFVLLSCGVAFAMACSSSSSNNNNGSDAATGDDSGSSGGSGSSSSGGSASVGDGGLPSMMVTVTCKSATDCTAGQVCCFSLTTFATSCVANQCAMGDYQQCASSNSECSGGLQCIVSPLGMGLHYCAPGDGGSGQADTGTVDAAAEAAATVDAAVDAATTDSAPE